MTEHKQRIQGYDISRAIAVFIMIIVNFNLVLADPYSDQSILGDVLRFLQGKGAALFVVLAGVGISLMIKKNLLLSDKTGIKQKRMLLLKRSAFLFVFGLAFSRLWPADILHFYGGYITIGVIIMARPSLYIWLLTLALIMFYPLILNVINYEEGWNWITIEYTDFWSINGFLRNYFINGFHPIIPWVSFLLAGLWLGRQNIKSKYTRNVILWVSLTVFILVQMISKRLIEVVLQYTNSSITEVISLYGTEPMPPMPLFMVSGISGAFSIISLCIWLSEKCNASNIINNLVKTGQMAFTHYITHIVLGIVLTVLWFGENNLTELQTFLFAIVFCFACMIASQLWSKKFKKGPMSLFIRYITKT